MRIKGLGGKHAAVGLREKPAVSYIREADDALIAAGLVYVDFMETVMDRIGEIMQPIAAGAIERSHIRGDPYDLVAAGTTSRQSDDQITVFKNGGGAHLDLMMASYVVDAVNA